MTKKVIKFEVYDVQRNVIHPSDISLIQFVNGFSNSLVEICKGPDSFWLHQEKGQCILLEFTNFFDSENTEIYEGDILQNEEGRKFVVEWNANQACWWLSPIISEEEHLSDEWPILHLDNQMLGNGYLKRRDMKKIGNQNIKQNG